MKNEMKALKEELRVAEEKRWTRQNGKIDESMVDYCVGKADVIVKVNGDLFVVDKEGIEKDFCFAYGMTQDFDEAINEEKSFGVKQFIAKNMRGVKSWIETIEKALEEIKHFGEQRNYALHSHCGITTLQYRGGDYERSDIAYAGKEELETILGAYKAHAENHLKKVNTYLKKYGLSKINTWTYWDME